jgi:small subunit ribosomal protein S9
MEMINATGRRKCSVARVYLKKGEGNILVNGKDYKAYFPQEHVQLSVMAPLEEVEVAALVELNADFRKPLKDRKFLTRDSREVERKKYGKPKARKSFQFSKR